MSIVVSVYRPGNAFLIWSWSGCYAQQYLAVMGADQKHLLKCKLEDMNLRYFFVPCFEKQLHRVSAGFSFHWLSQQLRHGINKLKLLKQTFDHWQHFIFP